MESVIKMSDLEFNHLKDEYELLIGTVESIKVLARSGSKVNCNIDSVDIVSTIKTIAEQSFHCTERLDRVFYPEIFEESRCEGGVADR